MNTCACAVVQTKVRNKNKAKKIYVWQIKSIFDPIPRLTISLR